MEEEDKTEKITRETEGKKIKSINNLPEKKRRKKKKTKTKKTSISYQAKMKEKMKKK
jgi:hypothetical protein